MDCGKLTKDIIGANCGIPPVMGVTNELLLINRSDIDDAETIVEGNIISSLVLTAGAKAYKFQTFNNGIEIESTLNKGKYFSTFNHKISVKVFSKTQDIKDQIENLKMAKFVAIACNKSSGNAGDTKYEAHGLYTGLELTEAVNSSTDADNVVYALVFGMSETAKEPSLPLSVFNTDMEKTKQMLDALCVVTPAT